MKKRVMVLSLLLSLCLWGRVLAQTESPTAKMSVNDRLVKARAAKAEKKTAKATGTDATLAPSAAKQTNSQADKKAPQLTGSRAKTAPKFEKATSADYKSSVDKTQHGPNREVIYTGARGAKYYINKNGNKTYLSSNL